jgi:hypothetical protein
MASSGMLRHVAVVRTLQEPHGVTSQKMPFFIVTVMKTSNLTEYVHVQDNSANLSKHVTNSSVIKEETCKLRKNGH